MLKSFNRLHEKVAIITGGGQGIGKDIGRAMVAEGAKAAIWNIKNLAQATAELKEKGPVNAMRVDVSSRKQVGEAVAKVISEWGKIDILVNCAAIEFAKNSPEPSVEEFLERLQD